MKMPSSRLPLAPGLLALAASAGWAHAQCSYTPLALRNATTTWTQQCDGRWSPAYAIDGDPRTGWALGDCWANGDRTLKQTLVAEIDPVDALVSATRVRIRLLSGGYSACCGGGNLTIGAFRLSVTDDARSTFGDGKAYGGDVVANWVTMTPDTMVARTCDSLGHDVEGTPPALSLLDNDVILASGADPLYVWYTIEADLPVASPTGLRLELVDFNSWDLAPSHGLPTGGPGRHANGNLVVRHISAESATAGAPVQIVQDPGDALVCIDGGAVMKVITNTPGVTYQWRHDGVAIPGANAALIQFIGADESDEGLYDCVVSNACESVVSGAARLNVCRPEFNCDGFLDFFDYSDFVEAFEAGEMRADYNRDGFLDFFDYGWYVDDFELGC